jgi:uncharacterized protein YjlB
LYLRTHIIFLITLKRKEKLAKQEEKLKANSFLGINFFKNQKSYIDSHHAYHSAKHHVLYQYGLLNIHLKLYLLRKAELTKKG